MLKTRIIGVVLVKEDIVVQSKGFKQYLPIGTPEIAIHYLDRWGVDEIAVLHIDATIKNNSPSAEKIKSYARQCQVPLAIGGGIRDLKDIQRMIRMGADKVIINASLFNHPEMISEGATLFGEQSIVASIDARKNPDQTFMTYIHSGKTPTNVLATEMAAKAKKLGAGEIFLTSIDHDGKQCGYNLELIRSVVNTVDLPVIACGGAGHALHLQNAIKAGASAVAVGNLFHFTEHSVTVTKQYLRSLNESIRLDTYFTYNDRTFDSAGRIKKLPDEQLDAMRFQYVPEEEI